jgi:hypothetical protein
LDAVSADLDEGERAAIALAVEVKADLVLIDEAAGRRVAKGLGMRITGTVGVLRLAAERGMIDVQDVLSQLRASGFYIDENVLRTAFEPWLSCLWQKSKSTARSRARLCSFSGLRRWNETAGPPNGMR